MTSNLKFLKDKLQAVYDRVKSSDDYKEMMVLQKLVLELEGEQAPEKPKLQTRKKRTFTAKSGKILQHGNKVSYVYTLVNQIVTQENGAIEIDDLVRTLKKEYANVWRELGEDNLKRRASLVNYILIYNKTEKKLLSLYPQKEVGAKKVNKYTGILAVQQEGKTNAA